MTCPTKIVLIAPPWDSPLLVGFVEECIRDGVRAICVVGNDCERVHDVIDELLVADGLDETRWEGLMTTWHTGETIDQVMELAELLDPTGQPAVVVRLGQAHSHPA